MKTLYIMIVYFKGNIVDIESFETVQAYNKEVSTLEGIDNLFTWCRQVQVNINKDKQTYLIDWLGTLPCYNYNELVNIQKVIRKIVRQYKEI